MVAFDGTHRRFCDAEEEMNLRLPLIAASAVSVLLVAGCSADDTSPAPPTPSSSAPTTVSPSDDSPPTPATPQTTVEVTAPPGQITFECGDTSLYQSGTALYSDGSTGYEPSCDTYVPPPERTLLHCDIGGAAVYTDGSYSATDPRCSYLADEPNSNPNPGGGYQYNPEEDRNDDGVVNGYERCGVLCGDPPTSGDIQTQHGCEEGYITGPSCDPYR
ncbi:hypothetical protein [Nocardia otitidiscaviarum]|uniref:hypothetical protein n=1 Tax=Nocardia otitidiscaviarum TaxID=1823 RepID=UPI0020CFFBB1|nr:hypothetical protein [Nocardia otitidiscaviarum]